MIIEMILVT